MLLFWTESCEKVDFGNSHWSLEIGFSICFMVEKTHQQKDRLGFSFRIWGQCDFVIWEVP